MGSDPSSPSLSPSPSPTVCLVSHEGERFTVEKELVLQSKVLSMFLSPELNFIESRSGTIRLYDIPSRILVRIIDYLRHRRQHEGDANAPEWPMQAQESLDLLLAADYLDL